MIGTKSIRLITTPQRNYVVDFSRAEKEGIISIFSPAGPEGALKHVLDAKAAELPDPSDRNSYSTFRNKIIQLVKEKETPSTYTISTRTSQFIIDVSKLKDKKMVTVSTITSGGKTIPLAEIKCSFTDYGRKSRNWIASQLTILESFLKAQSLLAASSVKLLPTAAIVPVEHKDTRRTTAAAPSSRREAKSW